MIFWVMNNGEELCTPCKEKNLREWGPNGSRNPNEDELVTPDMFTSIGTRPWEDTGEDFFQCDGCMDQWGPGA